MARQIDLHSLAQDRDHGVVAGDRDLQPLDALVAVDDFALTGTQIGPNSDQKAIPVPHRRDQREHDRGQLQGRVPLADAPLDLLEARDGDRHAPAE